METRTAASMAQQVAGTANGGLTHKSLRFQCFCCGESHRDLGELFRCAGATLPESKSRVVGD